MAADGHRHTQYIRPTGDAPASRRRGRLRQREVSRPSGNQQRLTSYLAGCLAITQLPPLPLTLSYQQAIIKRKRREKKSAKPPPRRMSRQRRLPVSLPFEPFLHHHHHHHYHHHSFGLPSHLLFPILSFLLSPFIFLFFFFLFLPFRFSRGGTPTFPNPSDRSAELVIQNGNRGERVFPGAKQTSC